MTEHRESPRVHVEMTERQLQLVATALDFYIHVAGLHQYEDVATEHRVGPHADKVERIWQALCAAKGAVGLDWNAGFSVLDEERVPERFRVALDLYADLRGPTEAERRSGRRDDYRASHAPRATVVRDG